VGGKEVRMIGSKSALFLNGAPRPTKMNAIGSPWRYAAIVPAAAPGIAS
jgi:hypothetical protein